MAILNISAGEYFQMDGLNASTLKPFVKSVKHGAYKLANKLRPSAAMVCGTLTHTLTLEGEDSFNKMLKNDYLIDGPINEKTGKPYGTSSNKYKEWLTEHGSDKTVITMEDVYKARRMSQEVKKHQAARQTMSACPHREKVITWLDPVSGIPCKAMIDLFGNSIIADLKTTAKMKSYRQMENTMHDYAYHLQFAFYMDGLRANGIDVNEFRVIFVSSLNEHDVACFRVNKETLQQGRCDYRLAINRYCEFKEEPPEVAGQFPDLGDIGLPYWAISESPFDLDLIFDQEVI